MAALVWSSTVTTLDRYHFLPNAVKLNLLWSGEGFLVSSLGQIMCMITLFGPPPPCRGATTGQYATTSAYKPLGYFNRYVKR